MNDTAFLLF